MRIIYIPKKTSPITTIKYGLLYNWFAVLPDERAEYGYLYNGWCPTDSRNMANTGWRVPTNADVTTLEATVGGASVFGAALKKPSISHWLSPNTGALDTYGFSAVGGGFRFGGTAASLKSSAFYYTQTYSVGTTELYSFGFSSASAARTATSTNHLGTAESIRLIKEDSTDTGTYVGNDGKVYPTVKIGSQVWLARNLSETKFRNGDDIPLVTTDGAYADGYGLPARCSYANSATYGSGSKIATKGWHVPVQEEIKILADYLGAAGNYTTNTAGGKLKETGLVNWDSPNTGADNSTLFNSRGSGTRSPAGVFGGLKTTMNIWGTTPQFLTDTAYFGYTEKSSATFQLNSYTSSKVGNSVRLLKDITTLSNGQTGMYTGNDGKKYRTICIGTQEWLADNLAETKYEDGSTIPEVTVDATWAALTTGARCAYNNDPSNV